MTIKNLVLVIIAVAILGGIAYLLLKDTDARTDSIAIGAKIFPDLPVNDVTKMSIKSADGTLLLEKQNDTWIVPDYHDFPAKFDRIYELLTQMYGLEAGQIIRVKESSLGKLQLADPSTANPTEAGTIIELFTANTDEPCATLTIGKPKTTAAAAQQQQPGMPMGFAMPDSQYVLTPNKEVVLVNEALGASTSPKTWIENILTDVPDRNIARVTVTQPDGATYTLARKSMSGKLTLEGAETNVTYNTPRVRNISSVFLRLLIEEIVDVPAPTTDVWKVESLSLDGITYSLTTTSTNSPRRHMTFDAKYTGTPASLTNGTTHVELLTADEAKERAEKLHDLYSGRVYRIQEYKANQIRTPRSALIKTNEEE